MSGKPSSVSGATNLGAHSSRLLKRNEKYAGINLLRDVPRRLSDFGNNYAYNGLRT
ncbi:unnamed protein product, partial [Protopolystoma xenopodis]